MSAEIPNSQGDVFAFTEANMDMYIKRVRDKLGKDRGMIETVRGIGYKMVKMTREQ